MLSVLSTKRSINETGFEVSTYTAILDDSSFSQCKLRQVVNKSPEPRFHHKTASLRRFTYYIYEQCKKSRQKQIGKVQWRRRVFVNYRPNLMILARSPLRPPLSSWRSSCSRSCRPTSASRLLQLISSLSSSRQVRTPPPLRRPHLPDLLRLVYDRVPDKSQI